jgi:hypothetical protein
MSGVAQKGARVRVRVQDQDEGAKLEPDPQTGDLALSLRRGLVSGDAFAALVVALAPLLATGQQGYEQIHRAV